MGHAQGQGRTIRRRAVWELMGWGRVLLVRDVAGGKPPSLSLPQFPHWQSEESVLLNPVGCEVGLVPWYVQSTQPRAWHLTSI